MSGPLSTPAVLRRLRAGLRRALVLLIGSSVLLVGTALLVLPGPGTPVLLAGLALLATEFPWADRALRRTTDRLGRLARRRPSRQAVVRLASALAGCAAVVVSVAGVDEIAGRWIA